MLKAYTHFCDVLFNEYGYERAAQMLAERTSKTKYCTKEFYDAMADYYIMRYRHGKYPCIYEWATFVRYFRKAK